jgi:hypothetical protein
MKKFKSLLFRRLPNSAHFNYCTRVQRALAGAPSAVLSTLGTLPGEFDAWMEKENALMSWVRKSALTEKIRIADRRQDRALVALKSQVRTLQLYPEQDVADAAQRVYLMLRNYGKVYNKPIGGKIGDLHAILDLLNGEYASDVARLDLSVWKDELQKASAQFLQTLFLRDEKSLQKPLETFRVVRYGIEKVYHRITEKVNAGAALNISPAFDAFIDGLNPVIDRLNEEFHRVRRHIRHAQPEGIPPQAFTGRPLTPTPAVFDTMPDGVVRLLQPGKDYHLSYRNNISPGNARCTLHGIGLYSGKRTVTFNILPP